MNNNMYTEMDDGSIEIKANKEIPDTVNFTNMMVAMTVPSDMKLDMKYIKKKEDINDYKVLLGNFPTVNHPENKLNPEQISRIENIANGYNSYADYSDMLNTLSPELAILLKVTDENVLGQEGAFQFAYNNNGTKHDIAVAMDENYADLKEIFIDKGVTMLDSIPDSKRMVIQDSIPGEQLATISNIEDAIAERKAKNANPQMTMKLGEYPTKEQANKEAANVNFTFLVVAAIAEVILLGAYLILLR